MYRLFCYLFKGYIPTWTVREEIVIKSVGGNNIGRTFVLVDQYGNVKFKNYTA